MNLSLTSNFSLATIFAQHCFMYTANQTREAILITKSLEKRGRGDYHPDFHYQVDPTQAPAIRGKVLENAGGHL